MAHAYLLRDGIGNARSVAPLGASASFSRSTSLEGHGNSAGLRLRRCVGSRKLGCKSESRRIAHR
jgi:hypothetical protein